MTSAIIRFIIIVAIAAASAVSADAQRRITPVTPGAPAVNTAAADSAAEAEARKNAVERLDAQGRTILVDTISGIELRDTVLTVAPKLVYPLYNGVTAGVNMWDCLMRAFGQRYGLGGIWAEVSLHNWFKPYVEVGLGNADYTPDTGNYTYRTKASPYFKIGLNYNFLYNSSTDYSVYFIVRYGLSRFSYDVVNVDVTNPYWDQTATISVPSQTVTSGYFEAGVGLRVMIAAGISVGWEVKAHAITNTSRAPFGKPWYIPGYGARGLFSGTLSVSYALPFLKPRPRPAATEE